MRISTPKSLLLTACLIVSIQSSLSVADDALNKANKLLKETTITDGHNDLPWVIRAEFKGDIEGFYLHFAQGSSLSALSALSELSDCSVFSLV